MPFQQLRIETHHPEFAEELCQAYGAVSVSFVDAFDTPVLEPLPGETPLWPNTITLAVFHPEQDLAALLQALNQDLPEPPVCQLDTLPDQDWVRVWLENWHPLAFGAKQQFWVCPTAKRAQIQDQDAQVMLLDPGLAFGTGTHPTTQLCLDFIADHDFSGQQVLDYGCGSGILAVGALMRGAVSAFGVDIDPQALTASHDNAQINGVDTPLSLALHDAYRPEDHVGRYKTVFANILAKPLITLAPRLADAASTGAHLVLAGLLVEQAEEVMNAYRPWFSVQIGGERDGWVRIDGRRT
jgi:ribosomal protein L11 methyltransferase